MRLQLKSVLFLLGICLGVACCSRPPVTDTKTEVADSSWTTESLRNVLVGIPAESARFTVKVECDSVTHQPKPFSKQSNGKRASVEAVLDKSQTLTVYGLCDSLSALVVAKDRVINKLRKEKTTVTIKIPVRYTAWYDMLARWIAVAAVGYFGVKFALKKLFL